MAIDMTTNTLQEKLGNPHRANRFYADFASLGLGAEIEDNLTYFLESTDSPSKVIGEVIVRWQGLEYKVPGDVTMGGPMVFTFKGDDKSSAYKYFTLWNSLVADSLSNTRGKLADIKKNIELHQLNDDGSIANTWSIKGMFVTEVGQINYSSDSSDTIITFPVTISYDDFTVSIA